MRAGANQDLTVLKQTTRAKGVGVSVLRAGHMAGPGVKLAVE
jgi:hypothetical protein